MRRLSRFGALVAVGAVFAVPATAGADPPSPPGAAWGQEVKTCNLTACYPGGTSRGGYVSVQAGDAEGPGYGYEIQTLAPIPADPVGF